MFIVCLLWFWNDSLQARELALKICANACRQNGVQLLDQTVALVRMGMGRNPRGVLQVRRFYGFEFSTDGDQRWPGRAVLLGRSVEYLHLELPDGTTIIQETSVDRFN
ncbi:MAG: DUF3301 domain-containing protein [Gammaproteobacteria bacterium]|nr:DUF3301 domain-containing protein [Gammaproteobacteria bacterium]